MMKRFVLVPVLILCCRQVSAGTLYVRSAEYGTIQSAIEDANDGDTIIVSPGSYTENIDFLGKAVVVRSSDPNDASIVAATVIDGSNPADPNIGSVATFKNGEGVGSVLSGFTIQNGTGQSDPCGASWSEKGTDGGGVFCRGASPTISKNVFRGCRVGYGGGAIYCHDGASPTIEGNTFIENYAGWYGGAIFARLKCSPSISGNLFKQNQCAILGGAIYLADQCYSAVTDNLIEGNSSVHLSGGGIYYFVNCAPTIANNFFVGNSSKVTGSGIMASGYSAGRIINNVFAGNRIVQASTYGAALGIYTDVIISNNIVVDNTGNGIYVQQEGTGTIIRNNNVYNNSLYNYAGEITDQTGINGNISADPQIGPELPEPLPSFELHPNSPCIDGGTNGDVPGWLTTDYDGTARVVNVVVDMGPQEYRAIAVPQDFNRIQEAIGAAQSGDEILVSPGFYQENLNFLGKNLTLRSLNPLDANCVGQTIIDGNEVSSCITLNSGEDKRSVIAGLTIQNGHGEFGGGIYIADNYGATILYNMIRNNSADRYGGGIDTRHASDTVIENNRVMNNYCGSMGAGIHVGARAKCRIFDNYIAYNSTAPNRQAGGIYCYNYADVQIVQNEICHNWSHTGGAMYGWMSNGTIERNYIWGNYATAVGGGVALHDCVVSVLNNVIAGNIAGRRGGGVYLVVDDALVANNTIAGNVSQPDGGAGISMEYYCNPTIYNNIISNNIGGFGVHAHPNDPESICEPNLFFNDLWSNEAGNYGGTLTDQTGVNGNISCDPCFVLPGYWADNNTPDANDDYWVHGNYRIPYFSPCRDAATDVNAPPSDFDGSPRPHFAGVDIGAYELQVYDVTGTGSVDFTDIRLLADSWLQEGLSMPADLNVDGVVDGRDFALFGEGWLR